MLRADVRERIERLQNHFVEPKPVMIGKSGIYLMKMSCSKLPRLLQDPLEPQQSHGRGHGRGLLRLGFRVFRFRELHAEAPSD